MFICRDRFVQVLRQKLHRVFPNVRVVSNRMEFDENGDLTGFKGKFPRTFPFSMVRLPMFLHYYILFHCCLIQFTYFSGRIIHVLNKNEHALEMAMPLHNDDGTLVGGKEIPNAGASIVQGRSNVLLLGDHLGDLGMSDGVDYENRISIGFL